MDVDSKVLKMKLNLFYFGENFCKRFQDPNGQVWHPRLIPFYMYKQLCQMAPSHLVCSDIISFH